MKKLFLLFIFVLAGIGFLYFFFGENEQKTGLFAAEEITSDEINSYLDFLNTERFTEEAKLLARNSIKDEFLKYGYKVTEQHSGTFVNVVAESEKGDRDNYLLLGAHYDTVSADVAGADDNGSGVAALLAIAKHNTNPNIVFVAFDGEESGFVGSIYYAENVSPQPSFVIVLEMLGYNSEELNSQKLPNYYNIFYRDLFNRLKTNDFRGNFSAAICGPGAKSLCKRYESYASSLGLEAYTISLPKFAIQIDFIKNRFGDLLRSDHRRFLLNGVPSVMITDTADFRNMNYHKPTDTRDTIDSAFIAKQANAVLATISEE